jgi:hypothetical protein
MDRNWEAVIRHAQVDPQDASFLDGEWIETPLYCACQHSPPAAAIQALVEAYPRALKMVQSKNKDVPLHIACRYRSSIQVLNILVDANPHMALFQTRWGNTPLVALCDGFDKDDHDDDHDEKWEKMKVILQGIARARNLVDHDGNLLLVHAAVSAGSLGCPKQVLDQVLDRYPHQVRQEDPLGRLPLHVATSQTEWSPQMRRRYKPREQHAIQALVRIYPDAIHRTLDQRRVLHRATANGHTWYGGLQSLFQANPDAAIVPDARTKFLPFMLAAIPLGQSQASLDTIYHLLRSHPHLLLNYPLPPSEAFEDDASMKKTGTHRRSWELSNLTTSSSFIAVGIAAVAVGCALTIAVRHRS